MFFALSGSTFCFLNMETNISPAEKRTSSTGKSGPRGRPDQCVKSKFQWYKKQDDREGQAEKLEAGWAVHPHTTLFPSSNLI